MNRSVLDRLRAEFGLLPTAMLAAAVALAVAVPGIDARVELPGVTDDPDTARQLVVAGASATVTFAGLVFSITVVALQLTSSQFSPRVLRQFLRDRPSQIALGTFVGVFIYDLLILARIDDGDAGESFVPNLGVDLSLLASAVAVFTFIAFVSHIAQSIRAVRIIDSVASESRTTASNVERLAADETREDQSTAVEAALGRRALHAVAARPGPGAVLQRVAYSALAERAAAVDGVIRVVVAPGDFVVSGQTVAELWCPPGGVPADFDWSSVASSFTFGIERTMVDDVSFGYRQLVDIAERALSPGINDPTTAVQCIDRIHDLLRVELQSPPVRAAHLDSSGDLRVVHNVVQWSELLALAVQEIRHYGASSFQVMRRLRAMLDDLSTVATPDDRPTIEAHLAALDRSIARTFDDAEDRQRAGIADQQGMGDDSP